MRFLANENFPSDAVAALRQQGYDVTWIAASSLRLLKIGNREIGSGVAHKSDRAKSVYLGSEVVRCKIADLPPLLPLISDRKTNQNASDHPLPKGLPYSLLLSLK